MSLLDEIVHVINDPDVRSTVGTQDGRISLEYLLDSHFSHLPRSEVLTEIHRGVREGTFCRIGRWLCNGPDDTRRRKNENEPPAKRQRTVPCYVPKKHKPYTGPDFLNRLPSEIEFEVCDYLDLLSLGKLFRCNKRLNHLPEDWTSDENWVKKRGKMIPHICQSYTARTRQQHVPIWLWFERLAAKHLRFTKYTARLIFRQLELAFFDLDGQVLTWIYQMIVRNQDPDFIRLVGLNTPSWQQFVALKPHHQYQRVARLTLVALGHNIEQKALLDSIDIEPGRSRNWFDPVITVQCLRMLFDICPESITCRHFETAFVCLPDALDLIMPILKDAFARASANGKFMSSGFYSGLTAMFHDDITPSPHSPLRPITMTLTDQLILGATKTEQLFPLIQLFRAFYNGKMVSGIRWLLDCYWHPVTEEEFRALALDFISYDEIDTECDAVLKPYMSDLDQRRERTRQRHQTRSQQDAALAEQVLMIIALLPDA